MESNNIVKQHFFLEKWDSISENIFNAISRNRLIFFAIAMFVITAILAIIFPGVGMYTACLTSFGSIMPCITNKFNKAKYHSDLFDKRFDIFMIINELLSKYAGNILHDSNEIKSLIDSALKKSFFLFGERTNNFIKEFREAIIYISNEKPFNTEKDNKIHGYEIFLNSLLDGKNLAGCFPELKIDMY